MCANGAPDGDGNASDGDGGRDDGGDAAAATTVTDEATGVSARYYETDAERVLAFERSEGAGTSGAGGPGTTAAIAQNREGYAMLMVRESADGDELERYYGFDMALDHAAELMGVAPADLPVPEAATDMGM